LPQQAQPFSGVPASWFEKEAGGILPSSAAWRKNSSRQDRRHPADRLPQPTFSAASVDQLLFWFLSDFNCMISGRRALLIQRRFHIRSLDQYVTMETKVGLI
jgi:hypothetical protein